MQLLLDEQMFNLVTYGQYGTKWMKIHHLELRNMFPGRFPWTISRVIEASMLRIESTKAVTTE